MKIFLKRLSIKLLAPFLISYWFIVRPETRGAKCLIECSGEYLLIKNTYGKRRWTLPGGGINKGETPEEAVRREIFEEVGIKPDKVSYLGAFFANNYYKHDTVDCYYAEVNNKNFVIDQVEISEAKWFSKNALPEPLSPNMKKFMRLYKKAEINLQ